MAEDALAALARAAPGWDEGLRRAVAARSAPMRRPDGARLFGPGDRAPGFIVPLEGAVRVEHMGSGGRSVVLYRVAAGETCVLTTACLISGAPYQAWGWAEGALAALAMPPRDFAALMEADAAFRAMVFGVFSARIVALVEVIDDLLLRRTDLRLAAWLAERGPAVTTTHQALANELGTAREVVSRILKDFERRGWLAMSRGGIAVREPAALAAFAAGRA